MRKHIAASVLCLTATSCIAAAVVAAAGAVGVVLYAKNEAYRNYEAPFDKTWQASVAATRAAGYELPAEMKPQSSSEGKFDVRQLKVRVEKHTGGITRVSVRIGTFRTDDHKRKAKLLLEDIGKRLK